MCGCKGKCGCNITSTTKGEKGDASPEATLGYKVYVALLSQSGTSAPTVTVLQNTLGGAISWTYNGVGTYNGTLNGVFIASKTFFTINKSRASGRQFSLYRNNDNEIEVVTEIFDAGTPIFTATDGVLNNTSILIEVYP